MTGAMYAAVSGLKSHMNKLNVIGNNIANVNTNGYKCARTTFQESLYTSVRAGSNGTDMVGGMNPAQIGYGCNIGTIDLDMSTKNYVPTGSNLDCMISGNGFFLTGDKPTATPGASGINLGVKDAEDLNLTRVGNFSFDSQGYLVDGNGSVIYGFVTATGKGGTEISLPGVEVADMHTSTQLVPIRLPLAAVAKADPPVTAGSAIYPGFSGTEGNRYDDPKGVADDISTGKPIKPGSINIDGATGQITAVNTADSKTVVVGYIALANVANPNGVTHIQGPYYRAGEGAGDCTVASIGNSVKGDLYIGKDTTTKQPILGIGETKLITNGLESSGTDIATEFSEMISTQRGYQANTRIITVTDSMLEELVNIKR